MISSIEEKDLKEISELILEEFPYVEPFKEKLGQRINEKKVFVFKLVEEKELIGFIDFQLRKGIGRINAVTVKKDFRRKGYGSELLKFAVDFLKERNAERITLLVKKENLDAKKLYERNGFRVKRELEKRIDDSVIEEMELM
ncbi:MAG: GNAT family N-acetyltransferase [archaeon]|nr:GNAT family N-acetyltransferase [Candidatus Micrarchaeota archaeon]